MSSTLELYKELLSLTKQYLQSEHVMSERILAETDSYNYFRAIAISQQPSKQVVQPVAKSAAVPPAPAKVQQQQPKAKLEHILPSTAPKRAPLPLLQAKPAVETQEKTVKSDNGYFKLEPFAKSVPESFEEWRKIVKEKLPHIALLDHPLDDAIAVKSDVHAPQFDLLEVAILSFDEGQKQRTFLSNMAKTLVVHGCKTEILRAAKMEQEKAWESLIQGKKLKLIIASSHGLDAHAGLIKHYREAPKLAKHFLDKTPLLLLSDITFYLKEPTLKPSLWKAIQQYM